MELALYHPEEGYYARERHRVGRGGDFVTSVSVGRCFGMLLARHLAPGLQKLAETSGGVIVAEPGAEGGELAGDVMGELAGQLPSDAFAMLQYVVVEPVPAKRDSLAERLRQGGVERF
jgi:SAM-dependent MidA family methyltransferase